MHGWFHKKRSGVHADLSRSDSASFFCIFYLMPWKTWVPFRVFSTPSSLKMVVPITNGGKCVVVSTWNQKWKYSVRENQHWWLGCMGWCRFDPLRGCSSTRCGHDCCLFVFRCIREVEANCCELHPEFAYGIHSLAEKDAVRWDVAILVVKQMECIRHG